MKPLFDISSPQQTRLTEACPVVAGATVSKALLNNPGLRVVVFSMDEGQEMSDHRAPFIATVHVLKGRLRFRVEGREHDLAAHDWLVMPPNAVHALVALEPTVFLLTMAKEQSE